MAIDEGNTTAPALDGVAYADAEGALTGEEQHALVSHARETIERFVTTSTAPMSRDVAPRLLRRQAAFVTIKKDGALRGCIGRLVPDGPLHWLVGAVALTTPRQVAGPDDLVPGRDGVVLVKHGKSAVFLPEVAADEGWTRDQWLDALSVKAGLEPGAWRAGALFFAFRTEVIKEER